ncbi:MAG TPA: hypothetical protein DCP69_07165 [Candidatus Omnitrophica bacterium]|nr:hypothetical protein [Candidatus Omnitrophota bacterium]
MLDPCPGGIKPAGRAVEPPKERRKNMLLGWYDRADTNKRIKYLEKRGSHSPAEGRPAESTTAYALRFFRYLEGTGNVNIVKLSGNHARVIAQRRTQ